MVSGINASGLLAYGGYDTVGASKLKQPAAQPEAGFASSQDNGENQVSDNQKKAEDKRLAQGCRTCASRKYQDGSDDPGVSFKSPTAIKPQSAGAAVMAHEQEHVTREKQKAGQEGREVIAQSVTLHMGICPECRKPFVAGGTTRTTTAAVKQKYQQSSQPQAVSGFNQSV